jgi:two-component system sensor histidine kinase PilS (NtrC family)
MRIVCREADRLSSLVTDFLMFARPPAGSPRSLDASRTAEEILDLFAKELLRSDQIHIRRDIAKEHWVRMDPDHLRQVLWNLLRNASEAIQESGEISVALFSDRNDQVTVRISDNGCGIPEDILPTVFDPFVTTKPHGTGLGLSIVHRIVESAGGRLDIESRPGEGTVVRLGLVRVSPEAETENVPKPKSASSSLIA